MASPAIFLPAGLTVAGVVAKSANFTVNVGDRGTVFEVTTGASAITATLPAAATAGNGWSVFIQKIDAGAGTVVSSPVTSTLAGQKDWMFIYTDGTTYYVVFVAGSVAASSAWTQVINETGGSLTNWTTNSGTWSTNGTEISQTDTTNAQRVLQYNTNYPIDNIIVQADIKIVATSTAESEAGFLFNMGGTSANGNLIVDADGTTTNTNAARVNFLNVGAQAVTISNIAVGTYFTFRAVITAFCADFYINSAFVGTIRRAPGDATYTSVQLTCGNGTTAKFKNIKAWNLTLPA